MRVVGRMRSIYDLEWRKHFEKMYDCDPFEFAFRHRMTNESVISPSTNYRYVVFIEGDCFGDGGFMIDWALRLEDGEHLRTYNNCCGFFTAQHIAYYQLIRNCKEVDLWYIDCESYDITKEEFAEHCDCHCYNAEEEMVKLLAKINECFEVSDATADNVLFVGGL